MINTARTYSIDDYIEILRRRIWYFLIPLLAVAVCTLLYITFAPRLYKATTLVLVTPQKVPEEFVHPTVTSKIEERLQSISQEVMSRTRLEQIISELRLYNDESKSLTREEVVELMQKDIKVQLPSRKDERGYFTVSYQGRDPNMVTTVANRLASLFIEENLRLREQQAVGTTEFLASELEAKKAKLEELESAVSQYKRLHMGELPEQRDTNLKILEQLQNQYQRAGESLRAAQDRKLYLQKQLSDLDAPTVSAAVTRPGGDSGMMPGKSGSSSSLSPGAESGVSYESQKAALTKHLDDLRSKYTENHPDVVLAKKKLRDLESRKDTYTAMGTPRQRELNSQLALTDIEIKRFQNEEGVIDSQIKRYRGRVESTPAREQEMTSLFREYQNTKDAYDQLLKKSQNAQQAENLERRQKGEQFKVIDPARIPEKPFSPDIPKALLIGLALSVGSALGAVIVREQIDRSFHDAGDVEITLGLRVLASIPKIDEDAA